MEQIENINNQKENADKLELKFKIGLIIIQNIYKINSIENIIKKEELDYIVVIRDKIENDFIENLVNNYKFINIHIFSNKFDKDLIKYDLLCTI